MLVSISGASGLIGRELIETYTNNGLTFRIINRDSFKLNDQEFLETKIEGVDAVINLAGAPILNDGPKATGRRFTIAVLKRHENWLMQSFMQKSSPKFLFQILQ